MVLFASRHLSLGVLMKRVYVGLLLIAVAACRRSSSSGAAAVPTDSAVAPPLAASEQAQLAALGYLAPQGDRARSAAAPPASAPPPPTQPGRPSLKLIRTASLEVEVPDFAKAAEAAGRAAASFGGYVSDRQSTDGGQSGQRGTITLRIPSDRFEGAVSSLKALGAVRREAVSTQDVTKQYSDLETRLRVKRETTARLREILTRQAGRVSEVLEVEREIARVVEEIEQAEGERRYYDSLVSLSTLTLTLYEPQSLMRPGVMAPIRDALRDAAHTMSESIAALILVTAGLLPWVVVLALMFLFARWRWAKRSVGAQAKAPPQP